MRPWCPWCPRCRARAAAQEPAAPQAVSPAQLQAAIDKLGDLDYATRTNASRTVRRTPAAQAVPALMQAVSEHADGYVRYRALVLLTGFNDPRTKDAMRESLTSPNDRLRTVAYSFFEHNPDRAMVPQFLTALDKEQAEFVRPALVRALAALAGASATTSRASRQALVREVGARRRFLPQRRDRGARRLQGAVRLRRADRASPSSTVRCRTMRRWRWARSATSARSRRSPALQRTRAAQAQPSIAAAICLLGVNCESHENYLVETLKFADKNPGFQELLRGAAAGLGALGRRRPRRSRRGAVRRRHPVAGSDPRAGGAGAGDRRAAQHAADDDDARAARRIATSAIALLAEGFDMLEEDLDKERFFASSRRTYWDVARQIAARAPDADADREARLLMMTGMALTDYKRPASTSTPATKPSAASSRWRAARSRPASSRRSDRSAACSASIATATASRCWCRAPTASAPSSRSRS